MRHRHVKGLDNIFTERFLPLYPRLYAVASAILGTDTAEAADAVQETMVKIWNSGRKMALVKSPEAYASVVLRHTAIDLLRRRHALEPLDGVTDISSGPPPEPDSAEFMERIILTLPESQQQVIRLSAYCNLSNDEIAAVIGHTPAYVSQLLCRGRRKIRELYLKHMEP